MRLPPRNPWASLWLWTLVLSAVLLSGCEARSCSSAEHPKVALLFLTRAGLLHTELWERWLSSAANLTDAAFAQQQLCSREPREPCMPDNKQPSHPFGQKLFSLYIHTGVHHEPGSVAAAAQPSNKFAEFYVRSSILTEWGQPTLIMAERLLLQRALQDRTNQRFVLLSESCIPLYSPQLIYQQLMGELRSRINACRNWRGTDDHIHRWALVMQQSEPEGAGFVPLDEWRYSSQWKSLNREHAELVAADYTVHPLFEERCKIDKATNLECVSDEHYIPTLLAHLKQEDEVDCLGYLTYNTWDPDRVALMSIDGHRPVDFKPAYIRPGLISGMRMVHCSFNHTLAMIRAAGMFIRGEPQEDYQFCFKHIGSYLDSSLQYSCHLFARKFGPQVVGPVLDLISGSTCHELGILAPEQCRAPVTRTDQS